MWSFSLSDDDISFFLLRRCLNVIFFLFSEELWSIAWMVTWGRKVENRHLQTYEKNSTCFFLRSLRNYSCRSSEWRLDDQSWTRVREGRESTNIPFLFKSLCEHIIINRFWNCCRCLHIWRIHSLWNKTCTAHRMYARQRQEKNTYEIHWNENNVYIGKIRKGACHHLEHIKFYFFLWSIQKTQY